MLGHVQKVKFSPSLLPPSLIYGPKDLFPHASYIIVVYMSKLYMTIKTDDVTCVTMECGSIWAVMGSSLVNRLIKPHHFNLLLLQLHSVM